MTVSVLIPAFRATYLRQAIASVLTQGYEDYELLISDDSGGDEVRRVVECFRDPRVAYSRTSGRTGAPANVERLWGLASRPRLKYLFDDDLLLPHALRELVTALEQRPMASFAFGHRDIIDAAGRVIGEPRLIAPNEVAEISLRQLAEALLKGLDNRVGEFSNVLINRAAGVELGDVLDYRGYRIAGVGDVALFLNCARKGPAIGIGRTLGQFRRHADQMSAWQSNPLYSKVVCEWELFIRGEIGAGSIEHDTVRYALATLDRFYAVWEGRLPELSLLRAGLPRLAERIASGDRDLLDAEFRDRWATIEDAGEQRRQRGNAAGR